MLKNLSPRYFGSVLLLIVFLTIAYAADVNRTSVKGGTLIVLVMWDDVDKTPATGVYIEAHSFAVENVGEKTFVLKMAKAGRYEATLPPGVYDVFVSEASSTPRCRRLLVTEGYTGYWNLMLEHDDVYLER